MFGDCKTPFTVPKVRKHSSMLLTARHGMRTWPSDEKSVCLSFCPSVKRVDYDKTAEQTVQIFILYERSFILVF